jgi:secretion/DNA translocation related TadE-like protein
VSVPIERAPGLPGDRGSGSVLVITVIMLVAAAMVMVTTLGSGYLARHGAAAAADLAALAAAEQLRTGTGDPCVTAREVSQANGAALLECTVSAWQVEVAVEAAVRTTNGWLADPVRRARAGVEPPQAQLPGPVGDTGWRIPIRGSFRITARFGQTGPWWSSGRHTGLDFAAPGGTAVVASAGGRVAEAGWSDVYGNLVVIDHGGVATYYAHLSSINVEVDDVVAAGQRVGAVGATGNATGPHLHLEVRIAGVPHDPESVLPDVG